MNPIEEYLVDQDLVKEAFNPGSWTPGQQLAATAITGVATPLALMAAHEGYQEVKGMIGRARGYRNMLEYNPKLQKMDAKKTKALFNTLHNAAPDLARDPVVASSWVNRMAYQDEYVDPRTLADLGSAQQRIAHKGLELPVGQITSGMMTGVGGMADQARRAESLALDHQKFEHQKARDAVSLVKDQATTERERAQAAHFKVTRAEGLGKLKERAQSKRDERAAVAPFPDTSSTGMIPRIDPSTFAPERGPKIQKAETVASGPGKYEPEVPFGTRPPGSAGRVTPREEAEAKARGIFGR